MKIRKLSIEFFFGAIVGFITGMSVSALSGSQLWFGCWRWNLDRLVEIVPHHGPVRSLSEFLDSVVLHSANDNQACWMLFAGMLLINVLVLSFVSRPICRHRYFIAGCLASVLATAMFVYLCDSSLNNWEGRGELLRASSRGSPIWLGLRHHVTAFWTVEDQFELVYLVRIIFEHLSIFVTCFLVPPAIALLTGFRGNQAASQTAAAVDTAFSRKIAMVCAVLVSGGLIAIGGIGLPNPERQLVEYRCPFAASKILKGAVIQLKDVSYKTVKTLPEVFVEQGYAKYPVGRKAKRDIRAGDPIYEPGPIDDGNATL